MYYGGGDHQTADMAAYGCMVEGQSPWARDWTGQPIGCTSTLYVK